MSSVPLRRLAPPRTRRRRSSATPPLRGILPLAVALALWQIFGSDQSVFYPRPSSWWHALATLNDSGVLWSAIRSTLVTLLLAMAVATAIGASLGYLIGRSRLADRSLSPTLEVMRAMPPAAIVPAFLILLGFGRGMSITVVTLASVWPILLNTRTGARSLNVVLLESARSLHLSPLARARKVVLPALLPSIFLGVRVAAPIALVVTLLVEFLVQFYGVGALIASAQRDYLSAKVYGLAVVAGVFGLVLNSLVALLENFALRHHAPNR